MLQSILAAYPCNVLWHGSSRFEASHRNAAVGGVVASDSAGNRANAGADLGSSRDDRHGPPPAVSTSPGNTSATPPRLLDQVRARMRGLGVAIRSANAYVR